MNQELKVIISAEVAKFKQGIADATKELGSLDKNSKQADKNIKAMGKGIVTAMKVGAAGVAAGAAAVVGFATKTASTCDTIDKMSQRLGLSREGYQKLDYVLSQSGVDINSFQTGVKSLTANMDKANEGNKTSIENFKKLGLSVTDSSGKLKSQEQMLSEVIIAFQGMKSGTEKSRLAMEMFGKQGQEILPLLNSQSGSFEALSQRAEDLGLVLGDDVIDAGVVFTDTMDSMKRSLGAVGAQLGGIFMPIVTNAMNFLLEHMDQIKAAVETVVSVVSSVIQFATSHVPLLIAIGTAIGVISTAIGLYCAVQAVQTALEAAEVTTLGALIAAKLASAAATVVALAPYIAIAAAIAAVIAVIVLCIKNWDKIKETVTKVAKAVKDAVVNMVSSVKDKFNAMKTAITEKVNAIKTAVSEKFEAVKTAIKEKITAAKETVSTIFTAIKSTISNVVSTVKSNVTSAFKSVKTAITTPLQSAKSTVSSIFESIKSAISSKINSAKSAVSSAISSIKKLFHFSWSLPKLKLPHVSISGKFSLTPPSVPKFGISWYAKGGVFDSTTLFPFGGGIGGLGENGAEAIVPLEHNTEWLTKIADMLSARMGGGNVVLEVDGKRFAEIACSSINDLTKQRGNLPLVLI